MNIERVKPADRVRGTVYRYYGNLHPRAIFSYHGVSCADYVLLTYIDNGQFMTTNVHNHTVVINFIDDELLYEHTKQLHDVDTTPRALTIPTLVLQADVVVNTVYRYYRNDNYTEYFYNHKPLYDDVKEDWYLEMFCYEIRSGIPSFHVDLFKSTYAIWMFDGTPGVFYTEPKQFSYQKVYS